MFNRSSADRHFVRRRPAADCPLRVLSRGGQRLARISVATILALLAVFAMMPAVILRRRPHRELVRLGRRKRARLSRRRPECSLHAAGRRHGLGDPALFRRIHGRGRGRRHAFLCVDVGLHRRLRDAGVLRQFADRLFLLGTDRPLLLFPGRLLVQAAGRRRRRAQGADHHPHRRLRTARRDHASLRQTGTFVWTDPAVAPFFPAASSS